MCAGRMSAGFMCPKVLVILSSCLFCVAWVFLAFVVSTSFRYRSIMVCIVPAGDVFRSASALSISGSVLPSFIHDVPGLPFFMVGFR